MATERRRAGVAPGRLLNFMADICTQEPLLWLRETFASHGATTHSSHVSSCAMVRSIGMLAGPHGLPAAAEGGAGFDAAVRRARALELASPFLKDRDRIAGHWLRDRRADHEEGPRPQRGHGRAAGAADGRHVMNRRYSQSDGRRGERREQLRVRCAMVTHVREALRLFGRLWIELPAGLDGWDILMCVTYGRVSVRVGVGRGSVQASLRSGYGLRCRLAS